MSPTYYIPTDLTGYIQIIPVSEEYATNLPSEVSAVSAQLPLGSFVLLNLKDKPIMTVTTVWQYVDNTGKQESRTYYCDGYLGVPSIQVVDSGAKSLISPEGCVREQYFPQLVSGRLIGAPFEKNKAFAAHADLITSVSIAIDSIIFSDGEVVGPDKHKYTNEIKLRNDAMRSVVALVASVANDHTAVLNKLEAISSNGKRSNDRLTQLQGRWASTLMHSPNFSGTIAAINSEAPLPTFFHADKGRQ